MNNKKFLADKILYEYGLWEKLNSLGESHIIGSYRMDLIVSNDLDIDVLNTKMSIKRLYELTKFIIETYDPLWYEAKQEINGEGKTVWFHGFETIILGELWNVDIWFFDQETISKAKMDADIIKEIIYNDDAKKEAIISIKKALINQSLYSYDQYLSINVYDAVLKYNVRTINEFFEWVKSHN